jgi:T-complex protein 1 subunit beta
VQEISEAEREKMR